LNPSLLIDVSLPYIDPDKVFGRINV
jgi:hypothetical protein